MTIRNAIVVTTTSILITTTDIDTDVSEGWTKTTIYYLSIIAFFIVFFTIFCSFFIKPKYRFIPLEPEIAEEAIELTNF